MKKYLSLLVIGIALFFPLTANAAGTNKVNFDCTQCVDNGNGCQRVCKISMTGDSITLKEFSANLKLSSGLTIAKVEAASSWDNLGNNTNLNLVSKSTAGVTGTNIELATVTINVPKNGDCTIAIEPTNYETVTVDVTVDKEVKTGATLPMAIIAGGALAAAAVYVVSKRNTKMYKI